MGYDNQKACFPLSYLRHCWIAVDIVKPAGEVCFETLDIGLNVLLTLKLFQDMHLAAHVKGWPHGHRQKQSAVMKD